MAGGKSGLRPDPLGGAAPEAPARGDGPWTAIHGVIERDGRR